MGLNTIVREIVIKILSPKNKIKIKQWIRLIKLSKIRKVEKSISYYEFRSSLIDIGLQENDVVMVHSSSDWLRTVDNGIKGVITEIQKIIGDQGTLLMPSFPFDGIVKDYSEKFDNFDVKRTVSRMGLVTEIFRRMDGVSRSLHPTHPVCAWGKHSEFLLKDHHLEIYPFGEYSPFYRFEKLGGKILLLGTNSSVLTHVHVVEDKLKDKFPIPVYLTNAKKFNVIDYQGEKIEVTNLIHNPKISRKKSISSHDKEFRRKKILIMKKLKHLDLRMYDSKKLTEYLEDISGRRRTIYK